MPDGDMIKIPHLEETEVLDPSNSNFHGANEVVNTSNRSISPQHPNMDV